MSAYDVVIIGAGPAGLMAACAASEKGARVLVLEKMNKAGKKLLITGNGRCNITNMASMSDFIRHIYPNGRFLKHVFNKFFNKHILAFLNEGGLQTVEEDKGKVYPLDGRAGDVLSVFLNRMHRNGVVIRYHCTVTGFEFKDKQISEVCFMEEDIPQKVQARGVILCAGGLSYPTTGSTGDGYKLAQMAGHTIIAPLPSLVPLVVRGSTAAQLQGVSLRDIQMNLWIDGKKAAQGFGEILFTHYGLSGPLAHTLSRSAVEALENKQTVELGIDLMPGVDDKDADRILLDAINDNGKKNIENILKLWLPSKMIPVFLTECNIQAIIKGNQLTADERRKIRTRLKDFRLMIGGHRTYKEAIVTAGGITTSEINGHTMSSRIVENLFFAGEVIDLDGDTGGFNLQVAFSTGYVAARSCCDLLAQ